MTHSPLSAASSLSDVQFRARIVAAYGFLAVGSVLMVYFTQPRLLRFSVVSVGELVQTLAPLVLVAGFIERALEVFVGATRGGVRTLLELEVQRASQDAAAASLAKNQLADWNHRTNRLAFVCGAGLGIIAAALGVRVLGLFLDEASVDALGLTQARLLTGFDVLLSGAVLGGGADALHKPVSAFTRFMDRSGRGEGVPGA